MSPQAGVTSEIDPSVRGRRLRSAPRGAETGDRSTSLRPSQAAAELDRRRSGHRSPNSRLNRRRESGSSSYLRGRDFFMPHGYDVFVGIDVAKESLEVFVLPPGSPSQFENTAEGRAKLLTLLPPAGACLSVVEATGGYERDLVAEMAVVGQHIAVVNPRSCAGLRQVPRPPGEDRSARCRGHRPVRPGAASTWPPSVSRSTTP
jgi:hypothetical protein